ncbi:hypothetical protein IU428_12455 [Nocardia abscessus]|nr:hypothetical protein [Nocardia abscessus]
MQEVRSAESLRDILLAGIERLKLQPGDSIDGRSLQDRLTYDWEIRTPSNDLVAVIAQRDPEGELAIVLQRNNRAELDAWLYGRDVLDLLETSPKVQLTRLEITNLFRPLLARQFSIASSPLEAPDRVDLTVATVRYGDNREYRGVATTYLADRIAIGETVKVFPQPNAAFGLPRDPAAALIMIGAGTGIAPFRGFLRDRQLSGATGRNWLFFGARHRADDFLYEQELAQWVDAGVLTHLDTAFSRDQAHKEYVQTRMLEHAEELYAWLEEGAYVYVCGNAERMAPDVESALLTIIATQRGVDEAGAQSYLDALVLAKRYLRDVY